MDLGTVTWPCLPPNTLAFNRFAAGWIDDSQVLLQTSGTNTVTLDAPAAAGMQMLVAPDSADPHVMLTLEARPKVGFDKYFTIEGVAAYIVDQRNDACMSGAYYNEPCISADRRQRQAISLTPFGYEHILQVGTTTTIDGVTITVTAKVGNTFTVQVTGTFVAPAPSFTTRASRLLLGHVAVSGEGDRCPATGVVAIDCGAASGATAA